MSKKSLVLHIINKYEPITQTEIAQMAEITPRSVKRIVKDLRLDGELIASGNAGYWMTETREGVQHTMNTMLANNKSHIDVVLAMERSLKKKEKEGQEACDDN